MKCDELIAYKADVTIPVYGTIADAEVYLKEKADAAIAELKAENCRLHGAKHVVGRQASEILLIARKLDDGMYVSIEQVNELKTKLEAENEKLKANLENAYDSIAFNSLDAFKRERRLKRSLWLARANSAEGQFFYWCARFGVESGFTKTDIRGYSVNTKRRLRTIGEWIEKWKNVKSKCRAKAEEYK